MNIEYPVPADVPRLRSLWKDAFGDTDGFLDCFFTAAFSVDRCRCATVQGNLAATLYWFDCSVEKKKMAYLYAVATGNAWRRQGICRALMADTHRLLGMRGYEGVLLVPGDEGVQKMYESMGYRVCTRRRYRQVLAGQRPAEVRPVDAAEYGRLRRAYLPARGVIQEGENLSFLSVQCSLYAGRNCLLAGVRDGDSLNCVEILGQAEEFPGILKTLNCSRGRYPEAGGEKAFAMFYPLAENAAAPAYFGLAFD